MAKKYWKRFKDTNLEIQFLASDEILSQWVKHNLRDFEALCELEGTSAAEKIVSMIANYLKFGYKKYKIEVIK